MILLLKDRTYRIFDVTSDREIRHIIKSFPLPIDAVAFESRSDLRSDCFTIVKRHHLNLDVKPFDIDVSIGFVDRGMKDARVIDQTFRVRSIEDFYNAAVLLTMLDSLNYSTVNLLHYYDIDISLVGVRVIWPDRVVDWKPKKSLRKFMAKHLDMYVDTDDWLATVPRDDGYDAGRVLVTGDYDGTELLHIGPKESRLMLQLEDGFWHLRSKVYNSSDDKLNDYYGFCINDTGLMYLAMHPLANELKKVSTCTATVRYGHYVEFEEGVVVPLVDAESGIEYCMFDLIDIFYGMVYLPQIIDFDRLVYDPLPVALKVRLKTKDRLIFRDVDIPCSDDGRVRLDFCSVIATVLLVEEEEDYIE